MLACDPSLHYNHHPCFKVTVLPNTHQNEWLHLKRQITPNTRKKMEQPELSCIVGETVKRGNHFEKRPYVHLPCGPGTPLPSIYLRATKTFIKRPVQESSEQLSS